MPGLMRPYPLEWAEQLAVPLERSTRKALSGKNPCDEFLLLLGQRRLGDGLPQHVLR
jgi:hypothetical protein